jgi:MFS family permease
MSVVITPIFQGLGAFFVSLERHFGWSRTTLSGAFSLSRAEGAILGPLEGYLIDNLGSRMAVLIGLTILGAGFIALSFTDSILWFYISFLIVFAGAGIGGFMPLIAVINNWFIKKRTRAMAIGMTGINLGGLLVPVLTFAIVSIGWRTTALYLGIGILILVVPIAYAIRNRPEDYGLRPDGIQEDPAETNSISNHTYDDIEEFDFTVKQAIKTKAFWAITAAHGFSAVSAVTITVHIIPALTDMGLSLQAAGLIVSIYTSVGVVFQLIGGYIGDKFHKPKIIAVFVSIQAFGMLFAALAPNITGALLFAVLYGAGFGGRIPLLTSIRGEYFGRKNFATIFGVSQVPMNIATMLAPIMAGIFFDSLGNYFIPFLGLAILNFIGAVAILSASKPVHPSSVVVSKQG